VIVLAGSRSIIDMQIRSVGIGLGTTTFPLVALSADEQRRAARSAGIAERIPNLLAS
jgi:hypothetical protein